jgi:drug/metabolite transporter (DMT)-like permease
MFANKAIYMQFPLPLAVTGASQAVAFFCGSALTKSGVFPYRPCKNWAMWLRATMPAAMVTCMTLYMGNLAVMMLPVTYVQIIKGLTPSITLLLAALLGDERLSVPLVATVLMISLGSGISCLHAPSTAGFDMLGLLVQVRPLLKMLCFAGWQCCSTSYTVALIEVEALGSRLGGALPKTFGT